MRLLREGAAFPDPPQYSALRTTSTTNGGYIEPTEYGNRSAPFCSWSRVTALGDPDRDFLPMQTATTTSGARVHLCADPDHGSTCGPDRGGALGSTIIDSRQERQRKTVRAGTTGRIGLTAEQIIL